MQNQKNQSCQGFFVKLWFFWFSAGGLLKIAKIAKSLEKTKKNKKNKAKSLVSGNTLAKNQQKTKFSPKSSIRLRGQPSGPPGPTRISQLILFGIHCYLFPCHFFACSNIVVLGVLPNRSRCLGLLLINLCWPGGFKTTLDFAYVISPLP